MKKAYISFNKLQCSLGSVKLTVYYCITNHDQDVV